ncbi:MAG: acyl carrier protein [Alphaproteobacteria bacterium]|nr:acyl carrier protein [Alphaproteobacteria bacterium]
MNEQEICRKVNDIIGEKLQVYPEQVVPSAAPYFDLGADSLDMVEVIMALEKTFGITISDIEAAKLYTVEDFQRICVRLLAETKSAK